MRYEENFPMNKIRRGKNIRNEKEDIQEFKDSIADCGVKVPIEISPCEDGMYEVTDGNRRHYACELLGKDTIRVLINEEKPKTETERTVNQMVMNLQRKNLSYKEEGAVVAEIQEKYGINVSELCKLLSKDALYIKKRLGYHYVYKFLVGCEFISSALIKTLTLEMALVMSEYPDTLWVKMAIALLGEKRWYKEDIEKHCAMIARGEGVKSSKRQYKKKGRKKGSRNEKKNDLGPELSEGEENSAPELKVIDSFTILMPMGSRHEIKVMFKDRESLDYAVDILKKIGGVVG